MFLDDYSPVPFSSLLVIDHLHPEARQQIFVLHNLVLKAIISPDKLRLNCDKPGNELLCSISFGFERHNFSLNFAEVLN